MNKSFRFAYLRENYFLVLPVLITILLYLISVTYGFRNFDEDILIKDFYVHKTFHEYIEKYLLIHFKGVTEAYGFAFSGIKNIHVSILGIPTFYIISFLFHGKAFLFHSWSLLLHCLTLYFFIRFCFNMASNKNIALFAGLLWTLHPTNVEPIIWATNWAHSFGTALYFYTLKKITELDLKKELSKNNILFILFISLIQILFTEHTITIPVLIFLSVFYLSINSRTLLISFKKALKISLPSFVIIFFYWLIRNILISQATGASSGLHLIETFKRIFFLSPQIFMHQIKLILLPVSLSIDQIDLLELDRQILGIRHVLSIIIFILFILLILFSLRKYKFLSFGAAASLITISPFIQIIPLYSLAAERYNYLSSAFLLFGLTSLFFKIFETRHKSIIVVLSLLCLILGGRSFLRIIEWKDSQTLFLSTINTSKTLLKKGIWTYNLAICQNNEKKKGELLKLSINLLDLFIQERNSSIQNSLFKKYELDNDSLKAKAAHRIATNYEILNDKENYLKYLLKALDFSTPNSQIQALIFKNLGTFYFQENALNKSLEYYKKSSLISPNPSIDYAISVCYLKMNDLPNYEKYLEKAASVISPYNKSPFKTYGQFLEASKNDISTAVRYYKIASLVENNVEPYILLTAAQLKLGQIDKAFKSVKDGLYGFPNNPSLNYFHAVIQINKGKLSEGIKDLIKIVDLNKTPKDIKIEACHILVNIFLNRNERDKALKYNEVILSIDKTDKEALKVKENLMVR